jgi:hypothetical protein
MPPEGREHGGATRGNGLRGCQAELAESARLGLPPPPLLSDTARAARGGWWAGEWGARGRDSRERAPPGGRRRASARASGWCKGRAVCAGRVGRVCAGRVGGGGADREAPRGPSELGG